MEVKKGFKQTEVGVIPEDWEVKSFGEIASIRKQKYDTRKSGIHLFCIELEHIGQGTGNLLRTTETSFQSSIKTRFNKNDVLFGRLRAYLRKYWLADRPGVASSEIWPLIANTNLTTPEYMFQLVQTDGFIQAASEAYGTHMPRTDWRVIKNHIIPIPHLPEQTEITKALSDADALIISLEKLIAKKQDIKQGAMQQLLTGKKRLPGFTGEWDVKSFKDKDVTRLITCGIAATPKYVDENTGVPFLSSRNVKDGKINWEEYKFISKDLHDNLYRNNPPLKGDILYSRVGTIGEAAIIDVDFEFSIYVSLTLIKAGRSMHKEFLKQLLNSSKYKELAKRELLLGGGVGNLNVNVVREFLIPIPSLKEQTAIAQVLSNMDAEIEALEQKLAKYRLIKHGMMQELLTGKKRLI